MLRWQGRVPAATEPQLLRRSRQKLLWRRLPCGLDRGGGRCWGVEHQEAIRRGAGRRRRRRRIRGGRRFWLRGRQERRQGLRRHRPRQAAFDSSVELALYQGLV